MTRLKNPLCKLAVVTTVLLALNANAQTAQSSSKMYGEIGWTRITYRESGDTLRPSALRLIGGAQLHPNLAIEGMLAFGLADDSVSILGVDVSGEVNRTWGLFIKPKASAAANLDIFGRVGYAKTRFTASAPGLTLSSSGSDLAYGVGASYRITPQWSANLDYMTYYNHDGIRSTGMTVGLGLKF